MEAHLCVRNNSYQIFVRNFQKNEPERRSGLKKRTGTPFQCVPVQFEPWYILHIIVIVIRLIMQEAQWHL